MTTGQLELPLFEPLRSTADDPEPEQERTHPAQMIIKHCGKAKIHVSHASEHAGWWGCPGTPDLRDGSPERERVREMELRTYNCGVKGEFHDPHPRGDGRTCPGLTARPCGEEARHVHHRWWTADTFHWCNGTGRVGRAIEDVELPDD